MLYHVTHTKYVRSIRKRGLLMFARPTNWIKGTSGERHGDGSIYAFDHLDDAVRWAAKMAWDYYGDLGSPKISIVGFDSGDEWEVDGADPLYHDQAKGRWLKARTHVKPEHIRHIWGLTREAAMQLITEDELSFVDQRS